MNLCFSLSMPNVGSWNGKWSGEGRMYSRAVNLGRSKDATEKAKSILDKGYFHYNFGDGWSAGVSVREVTTKEANQIRRKTHGFCGYDWMIDEILLHGRIIPLSERKDK